MPALQDPVASTFARPETPLGLLEIAVNPAPPGGEVLQRWTADGVRLRCARWAAPSSNPRGALLLLQGRAEFVEKYFETIGGLVARGFDVVTFDWRGQGRSDRALPLPHLGHVRDFADFRHDYEAVRGLVADRTPVTVLAHSMGAAIALAGARDGWLRADRLVCTNPMVGLSLVRGEAFAKRLAQALTALGFGRRIVPGGAPISVSTLPFAGNLLTADPARYERNAALARAMGWGAIGAPTIGWLTAAYAAMARFEVAGAAERISLPVLMLLSERDPVCSSPAMLRLSGRLPKGRTVTFPAARHELLMESDAVLARLWTEFDAFLDETGAAAMPLDA